MLSARGRREGVPEDTGTDPSWPLAAAVLVRLFGKNRVYVIL